MESHLLLAMNVHSLFAGLAMNMKEERAIRHALSVKPDSNASKVRNESISAVGKALFASVW